MVFTKENMVHMLKNNIMTVSFTKVDGTDRVMKCTLISDRIPNAPMKDGELVIRENKTMGNTISVWDLEANGWRSFRVDSVKSVSVG